MNASLDQLFEYFDAATSGQTVQSGQFMPIDNAFQSAEDAISTAQEIARVLAEDGMIPQIRMIPATQLQQQQLQQQQYEELSEEDSYEEDLGEPFDPLVRRFENNSRYQALVDDYEKIFSKGHMRL